MLTHQDIQHTFRALGIGPGDHLLIHSSLRKVGPIDGGADGLLDALLDLVGTSGTVAVPTSSGAPRDGGCFDPIESRSGSGILAQILRKRPEAVRSLHPTHSLAAIGERADEFTRNHLEVGAVGAGSPYDLIARAGGYVVLLGVTHTANTTIHVGEDYAGMRKLGREHFLTFKVRMPDGTLVEKQQDNSNSCSSGFNVLELPLRLQGKLEAFRLGGAASSITKGRDLIDTTVELIGQHPDITRCMQPGCAHCDAWRRLHAGSVGRLDPDG